MRRSSLAATLLLATACTPMDWVKPDATPGQREADARQCQEEAWREASSSYMGLYRPFGPWMYRDAFGRPLVSYPYGPFADPFGDRYTEEQRLANFCMRAKGYELAPVAKK